MALSTGLPASFPGTRAANPPLRPACPPRRPPRHRLIKALQWILLGLAVASLATGFLWPQFWPDEDRIRIGVSISEDSAASKAEIRRLLAVTSERLAKVAPEVAAEPITGDSVLGARFVGATDSGRPYVLTADFIQTSEDTGPRMLLNAPNGKMTLEDGTTITLSARAGVYDRSTEIMTLAGDVTLVHGAGYDMRSESARIDLATMTARGSDPVVAKGPDGTASGEGFEIDENGSRIVFTGKSRATLRLAGGSVLP